MKSVFDIIKKAFAWRLSATAVFTMVFAMGAKHESKQNRNVVVEEKLSRVITSLDSQSVQMDSIMSRVGKVEDRVINVEGSAKNTEGQLSKLQRYMIDKAATKEDLIEVYEIWNANEKKKENGSSLLMIPLGLRQ